MKLKKGYKFILELGERKLNKYEIVGTDLYVLIEMLEKLTPYAPPIDVQPVVRCRNCQHYEAIQAGVHGTCTELGLSVKDDSFCSCGELKGRE